MSQEPIKIPSPFKQPRIEMLASVLSDDEHVRYPVKAINQVAELAHQLIGHESREHLIALYLDARHHVTHVYMICQGSNTASLVHPSEVIKGAIYANAPTIIIAHNHPSGDVKPSKADHVIFDTLIGAGKIMGIEVMDSLIVGPNQNFYTMREKVAGSFTARAGVSIEWDRDIEPSAICPICNLPDLQRELNVRIPVQNSSHHGPQIVREAMSEPNGDPHWCPNCKQHVEPDR